MFLSRSTLAAVLTAITLGTVTTQAQQSSGESTLESIQQEGIKRAAEGQAGQQQVDEINSQTRKLIDEYRSELKIVEGLETYINMLDQQLEGQKEEISTLQKSITDVAVIERQILPLMSRMIDSLEQFVSLDVPFLMEERNKRVTDLRELLGRSDVTVSEKSRRVFEAFQVETDYGRTIEAYKAKLDLGTSTFDADFLRVGRVALMYRTVGESSLGYWDKNSNSWQPLPGTPYRRLIEKGLQVARQDVAPELISIPLNPSEVEQLR